MANNQGPKEQGNGGAPQGDREHREPRVLMPSEIAGVVQTFVVALETVHEQSQRRILESVRVQLGLMPAKDGATQQRPPAQNQQRNQQTGNRSNGR